MKDWLTDTLDDMKEKGEYDRKVGYISIQIPRPLSPLEKLERMAPPSEETKRKMMEDAYSNMHKPTQKELDKMVEDLKKRLTYLRDN